jgi:hypothetical protein
MSASDLINWFSSQSMWRQVFIGLWLVFIALPIATLTVLQFLESIRGLQTSTKPSAEPRDDDKG